MPDARLQVLIFDVDGTLADTEAVHLQAFNEAFAQEGMPWRWSDEQYTGLLEVSGGRERMLHYWQSIEPDLTGLESAARAQVVGRLHEAKTAAYKARAAAGAVSLRPGVLGLMEAARGRGLLLAIATTTSPANIDALLRPVLGPDWRLNFASIADAATAPMKKPHPQAYRQVLHETGRPAGACIALEDSHNGLRAALAAGVAPLITPTRYTAHHDFSGALAVRPDLQGVTVDMLQGWLGQRTGVAEPLEGAGLQ